MKLPYVQAWPALTYVPMYKPVVKDENAVCATTSGLVQMRLHHSRMWANILLFPPLATMVCAAQQGRPDILAAGYGQHAFGAPGGGLIALWSLKNPGAPLWSAATGAGVASLDWAAEAAGLLAVGLLDGTVAVYDARSRQVCCKVLGLKT